MTVSQRPIQPKQKASRKFHGVVTSAPHHLWRTTNREEMISKWSGIELMEEYYQNPRQFHEVLKKLIHQIQCEHGLKGSRRIQQGK